MRKKEIRVFFPLPLSHFPTRLREIRQLLSTRIKSAASIDAGKNVLTEPESALGCRFTHVSASAQRVPSINGQRSIDRLSPSKIPHKSLLSSSEQRHRLIAQKKKRKKSPITPPSLIGPCETYKRGGFKLVSGDGSSPVFICLTATQT